MQHIQKLLSRSSERNYKENKIEQEKIDYIYKVINSSPTSNNSHDYSVINVADKELRRKISFYLDTQKHIVDAPLFLLFVADSNRLKYLSNKLNSSKKFNNSLNSLITSCGDAFIAASFAHSAALSLDLHSCFVGIVRGSIPEICKSLNLNENMIPIIGLTIGYGKQSNITKPKINHIYEDKYNLETVFNEVEQYELDMNKYYKERENSDKKWSETLIKSYDIGSDQVDKEILKKWNIK